MFSILSRANFSRVKSVIKEAISNTNIKPIIILGGGAICEDYGGIENECISEGINIDEKTSILMHEKSMQNMVRTTALGMLDFSRIIEKYNPDVALTVADRYETISFAISCSYMKIPLIHLQGGEPTGSIDDKVRNAIAQLADYHFVCTNDAYLKTIKWGEMENRVFNVGCPSLDHLDASKDELLIKQKILEINKKYNTSIDPSKKYCVLLFHPDTKKSDQEFNIVLESTLRFINNKDEQLIVLNPNPDYGSEEILKILKNLHNQISLKKQSSCFLINNLNSEEYISLIKGCEILIGNSSSGIRESSFLGIKSLNIGERQSFRYKCSNVTDVSCSKEEIISKLALVHNQSIPKRKYEYGDGTSSIKIIKLIEKLSFDIKPTKI
tara:strand:- start:777 stop:1925 length:1149 start_codon:yes stop_codon:yes gene_type:complete